MRRQLIDELIALATRSSAAGEDALAGSLHALAAFALVNGEVHFLNLIAPMLELVLRPSPASTETVQ